MSYLYVLIGENGEYEQFCREVMGVFSSQEEARAAIQKLRPYGKAQWEKYEDFERRRKEYLKRFTARSVINATPIYTREQYIESEAACGPKPALAPSADTYVIERFGLDVIEEGDRVEEIAGET